MFKRVSLLIAFAGVSVIAKADENSERILARIAAELANYGNYAVEFTASVEGMGEVSGEYVVGGNKYYIKVEDQEQFSDGVNRYEIFPFDREVVIDKIDTGNTNILSNPVHAFEFAPEEFASTYSGRIVKDGVACEMIKLYPIKNSYGVDNITLYTNAKTGLPVSVIYDYEGDDVDITIGKITALKTIDPSRFVFDKSKYAGYDIIDFR